MDIVWTEEAWEDFQEMLESGDRQLRKKLFALIKDISVNGAEKGLGKPERLKHNMSDYFSRRISDKDRLVYRIDEDGVLHIVQCRTHYHKS